MKSARREHAIVIGASMAGLGAARALSAHFQRVTVVERDVLPTTPQTRKGVPQGSHSHGLLSAGYHAVESFFPGIMDELVAEGISRGDTTRDYLLYHHGHWKLRAPTGHLALGMTRPHFESKVASKLRERPNVTVLENHDAVAPLFDSARGRVTGLVVRERARDWRSTLDADLLIDASGRGSSATKWLAEWGYGTVPESKMPIDVGYTTAIFEREPGDLQGTLGYVIAGSAPHSKRYCVALAVENNGLMVTLAGCLGDHPPKDLEGWREYARGLPTPDVADMLRDRQPIAPLKSYRFTGNHRRYFERLTSFPRGFLVLGDAWCGFNPVYAQGMAVALSEARVLDQCLAATIDERSLTELYFARCKPIIGAAWMVTTIEDHRYPELKRGRPFGHALIASYMKRVHRAAARDPVVLQRLLDVASLCRPPASIASPGVLARVLRGGVPARTPLLQPPASPEGVELKPDAGLGH
jgi:2-polyprenyl-6-methoxyphenol hydroxylase-like FAD-dependent oxidoreductase